MDEYVKTKENLYYVTPFLSTNLFCLAVNYLYIYARE